MKLLEKHFDLAFTAPNGVQKLRELILTFAMQGKLVPQDPKDEPASELLKAIEAEKIRLVREGKIKQPKPLPKIKSEGVPYGLPQEWEWVRLAQLASIQTGKKDVNQGHENGLYPFFSCAAKPLKSNGFSFDCEALLLPGNGANVGLVTYYVGKFEAYQRTYVITDFSQTAPRYIENTLKARFLKSLEGKQYGSAINYIKLGNLTDFLIPLPPLPEQHRIVAKIDQLMARCDELEKLREKRNQKRITIHTSALNRLLTTKESNDFSTAWRFITKHFGELYSVKENVTELRKEILQLAVMGKLVDQDQNDDQASDLLNKIRTQVNDLVRQRKERIVGFEPINVEDETFPLPENWLWVRLGSLLRNLRYGTSKKCAYDSPGTAVLRIPNIDVDNGRIHIDDLKYTNLFGSELQELYLKPNDLLMIRSNGSKSLVGRTAVVSETEEGLAYAGYLVRLRSFPECVYSRYLCFALSTVFVREQIERPIRTTSGVKNINSTEISNLVIPFPPLAEQRRIVAKTDQLMALCDHLEKQIDAATSKRTELLNALMAQV